MVSFRHTRERVIVALDTTNPGEIADIVGDFSGNVWGFKVGIEAITKFGPSILNLVRRNAVGANIFYDGKFHDIPNTIAGATRALVPLDVQLFNIHASSGMKGVKAAVEAKSPEMKLLGVTVLTSHDPEECDEIYGADTTAKVMQFARMLAEFGAEGIVCSANEVALVRSESRTEHLLTVVPGIRLLEDELDDQVRVMTPGKAIAAGADLVVMGRSLTSPKGGNRLNALVCTEINIEQTLAFR